MVSAINKPAERGFSHQRKIVKRNLDLVREILLWVEGRPEGRNVGWKINIDGYSDEEIGYHVYLMNQAGLLIATDATFQESLSPYWIPNALTWDGHDFLASIKDDTVWKKAKEHVILPMAGVAFSVLKEWLAQEAKHYLGPL